ncbi:hypothetical protein KCU92_g308, partial [Aureobasidium melanogenum]
MSIILASSSELMTMLDKNSMSGKDSLIASYIRWFLSRWNLRDFRSDSRDEGAVRLLGLRIHVDSSSACRSRSSRNVGSSTASNTGGLIARGRRSALTALLSVALDLDKVRPSKLFPRDLDGASIASCCGGHSRLAFEGPGVTNHQAKQDRLRPSSASRQSYAKFEGQKKSVSSRGQVWPMAATTGEWEKLWHNDGADHSQSAAPSLMYPSSKQRNQGRLDLYEELFSNPSRTTRPGAVGGGRHVPWPQLAHVAWRRRSFTGKRRVHGLASLQLFLQTCAHRCDFTISVIIASRAHLATAYSRGHQLLTTLSMPRQPFCPTPSWLSGEQTRAAIALRPSSGTKTSSAVFLLTYAA